MLVLQRRRTQIRLAQRAYRQRKETTISSLQEQNSQLRSIINQMNDVFQNFNEAAAQVRLAHLNLPLEQELQRTTEIFARLVKTTATVSDHEAEHFSPDATSIDPAAEWHNATATTVESRNTKETASDRLLSDRVVLTQDTALPTQIQEDQPVAPDFVPNVLAPTTSGDSTQAITRWWRAHSTTSVGQIFDQSSSASLPTADVEVLPFGLVDTNPDVSFLQHPETYPVVLPTPDFTPPRTRITSPIMSSLNSPAKWTYSLDEITFSRRLRRRSLEAGLYILSSSKVARSKLEYIFRLTLPFLSLDQIREHFRQTLQSGLSDSLEIQGIPFKHIGGAGTHFRTGRERSWNPWAVGPPPPPYMNKNGVFYVCTHSAGLDPSLVMDMTGYEGEWFDPSDVEGYLEQEKGCRIDPQASFAECLIDVDEEEVSSSADEQLGVLNVGMSSASSSTGSSSTHCSPQSSLGTDLDTFDLLGAGTVSNQSSADGVDFLAMMPHASAEASSLFAVDDWSNAPGPSAVSFPEPTMPVVKQKRKKVAWVDVSKLVEG